MSRVARVALLLALVLAFAFRPSRRWLSDVLLVTARHLDHGPDADPPPGTAERSHKPLAEAIAEALIRRGQNAPHHHDTNGHRPAI